MSDMDETVEVMKRSHAQSRKSSDSIEAGKREGRNRTWLLAKFISRWDAPVLVDKQATLRSYIEGTRHCEWRDLVMALNLLFGRGAQFRPSVSECYAEAQRVRYRRRRAAGWVPQLSEDDYVARRLEKRSQTLEVGPGSTNMLGEGSDP